MTPEPYDQSKNATTTSPIDSSLPISFDWYDKTDHLYRRSEISIDYEPHRVEVTKTFSMSVTLGLHAKNPKIAAFAREKFQVYSRALLQWPHVQSDLERMYSAKRVEGKRCPHVPREREKWLIHVIDMIEAQEVARFQHNELQCRHSLIEPPARWIRLPFNGKVFGQDRYISFHSSGFTNCNAPERSAVLCEQTIWTATYRYDPTLSADWPSKDEMLWEGDQRVATEDGRYGRFPALARNHNVPGIDPEDFHNIPPVMPFEFDKVWTLPQMDERAHFETEEILGIEEPDFLNSDLIRAIDHPLDKFRGSI